MELSGMKSSLRKMPRLNICTVSSIRVVNLRLDSVTSSA